MVSVRKRKMARSSVGKATRRHKDKQRKVNIASNPIIAANWDKNLTLSQNYAKLGLKVRLGKDTGGVEKKIEIFKPKVDEELFEIENENDREEDEQDSDFDPYDPENILEGTAKLVRDDEGNVIKVIYGTKKPSNSNDSEESEKPKSEVIKQLEAMAANKKVGRERKQSDREVEWLKSLYEKYGDDYEKMKWDKKLNPMQHSPGELKKRFIKWKKQQGI
ncbi:hypothetical protein CANARDRAFT_218850 [[Candida] arabinofermentans NRRL YB-2248]|uniref:Nucleolar protein 16 n=1 Tax=[Candida] arabinofermentans NRRL YB-2248 TaxID=983967 RepID=A0A1E4T5M7_9ASCO|nr:hypothetical protein CANARDRAFT_218850 [[Candida] arabinofermentans NRRL YB-2248]